ncbi:inositol polyphosphate 5-phosphatase OCRL-like [Gigantopelta aegis]|uniref:inositol polyphosphate 5-phosphatase OCRL-like n=1 Tax=Gigantopelta aegis TaxID=1735272 RepID=UPI001B88AE98|nr:inositol polyphosphate 5-phosphatase OCRL-like [Gigantopelta aegis]
MDPVPIVQKLLSSAEKCKLCIQGKLVVDWTRTDVYLALVENKGDCALFLYTSKRIPCFSSDDLSVDSVIPVDQNLRFMASGVSPSRQGQENKDFSMRLECLEETLVLELPQMQTTQQFLAELKHMKDVQAQIAGFGVPSQFTWLDKYRGSCVDKQEENTNVEDNPFAKDVFKPPSKPNIESNNVGAGISEAGTQWFVDNHMDVLSPMTKSTSRDSLDDLDKDTEVEELGKIEQSLGLGSGMELPVGQKPVTTREAFVRRYMIKREEEFTDIYTLKVFCGTWNVNGQSPKEGFKEWLCFDEEPPDIYAIGFQELDLSKEAFIFSDSLKETEWQKAVKEYIHPNAKYRKVKSIRLVGVLLIVYIQEKHVKHVHFIDADSVATGIMGLMGNKGGVAIRMSLYNSSICFVNSHLAAHIEEVEKRNQDYRDIESKIRFKQFVPPLMISEHDQVFWMGDLNYRLTSHTWSLSEVKTMITKALYGKLMQYDQLHVQLHNTSFDVFRGYTEGNIIFQPTYKYDPGSDTYDTSDKARFPAWCDRVLWKGTPIKQLRYDSHMSLKISDHKPVSALFDAGIRVIDQEKSKKVYEDVMKKLDRIENEYLPQVKLERLEFVFKDVKFLELKTQSLSVANIGQVPVNLEFINKLNDETFCKPWLRVSPCKHILLPGESCEIAFEVYVDKTTAADLNKGIEQLEDILVLHLAGGKDFFMTVSGNYIPSSFGSSIEALVQMHGPIREVPVAALIELGHQGSIDRPEAEKRLYLCPKEVYRMVNHLYEHGKDEAELFKQPGKPQEIRDIIDCLDTGVPDKLSGGVHAVAECLLLFLESLADPVIPFSCYQQCLDYSHNFQLCKQLLTKIPECHRNLFKYICAFLRELMIYNHHLDAKFLSTLFSGVLIRSPTETRVTTDKRRKKMEEEKKAMFIHQFLTNEYDD